MAGQLSLYEPPLAWAVEWRPRNARLSRNGPILVLSWSYLVVSQGFPRMNLRSVAGQARLGRRSKAEVMVLATGVISGDVSSSFKAIEFGPPFVLSNHNDCDGGCDIEPGGLCRQRQKSRGVVVECSYCAHAFHLRCLPSTVRDKVMDSQGHWAYDSSVEAGGESANTYEFADSGAHDKLRGTPANHQPLL